MSSYPSWSIDNTNPALTPPSHNLPPTDQHGTDLKHDYNAYFAAHPLRSEVVESTFKPEAEKTTSSFSYVTALSPKRELRTNAVLTADHAGSEKPKARKPTSPPPPPKKKKVVKKTAVKKKAVKK